MISKYALLLILPFFSVFSTVAQSRKACNGWKKKWHQKLLFNSLTKNPTYNGKTLTQIYENPTYNERILTQIYEKPTYSGKTLTQICEKPTYSVKTFTHILKKLKPQIDIELISQIDIELMSQIGKEIVPQIGKEIVPQIGTVLMSQMRKELRSKDNNEKKFTLLCNELMRRKVMYNEKTFILISEDKKKKNLEDIKLLKEIIKSPDTDKQIAKLTEEIEAEIKEALAQLTLTRENITIKHS